MTPEASKEAKESTKITRWRLKHSVSNIVRPAPGDLDSPTPGVCKCGTAGHKVEMVELVRRASSGAGVTGVYFCDSAWLCPTCAPRRAAQRAEKVTEVFKASQKKGGEVAFVTLTTHHKKADRLAVLKSLVTDACRKARQGKPWKLAKERFGIAGILVSPEVTYSEKHGWHFHLHLGIPMLGVDMEKAEEGGEWLLNRYMSYIRAAGGTVSRKAQDVTVVWRDEDLKDYLAKGSAAWEVSNAGATKEGRSGLTPWDLATRAAHGDAVATALFREYAATMPGTRSCVVSAKLAKTLGIQPSDDKDKPGVEQADDVEEVVGAMPPFRWHRILRNGCAADVLKAVDDGWNWPEIDDLISRLLHENPTPRMKSPPYRQKEHAPSADTLAREVLSEAHQFRGRKGRALQMVMNRHREQAADTGKICVLPNLKSVLDLMAA